MKVNRALNKLYYSSFLEGDTIEQIAADFVDDMPRIRQGIEEHAFQVLLDNNPQRRSPEDPRFLTPGIALWLVLSGVFLFLHSLLDCSIVHNPGAAPVFSGILAAFVMIAILTFPGFVSQEDRDEREEFLKAASKRISAGGEKDLLSICKSVEKNPRDRSWVKVIALSDITPKPKKELTWEDLERTTFSEWENLLLPGISSVFGKPVSSMEEAKQVWEDMRKKHKTNSAWHGTNSLGPQ